MLHELWEAALASEFGIAIEVALEDRHQLKVQLSQAKRFDGDDERYRGLSVITPPIDNELWIVHGNKI